MTESNEPLFPNSIALILSIVLLGFPPFYFAMIWLQTKRGFGNLKPFQLKDHYAFSPDLPPLGDQFRAPLRSSVPALFITGEMDGRTPMSNAEEVAAGFPNHQQLIVANAGHGILGYPELTPAVLAFLRGQRIPQTRVSFPKWEFKRPADRSQQ